MNIVLGYGLENIYFGLSIREIVELLGKPDKEFESDFDFHIQYYSLQGDFWFRKQDLRLHWIQCSHPSSKIFDRLVISKDKEELIMFIRSNIFDEIEINDYGSFESYYFKNTCLELQFKFNLLEEVCFGHFFDREDKPIWI